MVAGDSAGGLFLGWKMAQTYEILEEKDFDSFTQRLVSHFAGAKQRGEDFTKLKIVVSKLRKSKTPAAHRKYFACVGQAQKRLIELGYDDITKEELHQYFKKMHGFTKLIHVPGGNPIEVTRSIADKEEVNNQDISSLIEFVHRFCAEKLDYCITEGL